MNFYRFTLLGMLIALGAAVLLCWNLSEWARQASREARAREADCTTVISRVELREQELEAKRVLMSGMHDFLRAWEPHQNRVAQEKDVAVALRTTLETLAQRKLSLVTDQVTVPEPGQVMFGKKSVTVQRVSMRANGESLISLIAWLGEAEECFPLARVESWELSAVGGAGLSLKLMLAQPIQPFLSIPSQK